MAKKIGRPSNNPKLKKLSIRLDNECCTILEKYCTQENINKTEAIHRGIKRLEQDLKKN